MAHTKAKATTQNVRDSRPKYLGVKLFGGQLANIGSVIIRQRGTKFAAGNGVRKGSDDTIYAVKKGVVVYRTRQMKKHDGSRKVLKIVSVV